MRQLTAPPDLSPAAPARPAGSTAAGAGSPTAASAAAASAPMGLLGAMAAGLGLGLLATMAAAQTGTGTTTAMPSPPAEAEAPAAQLPVVKASGRRVEEGRDTLKVERTRIGKGSKELRDVGQSLTIVTEQLIDDRRLDTVKEALANTSGISFQAAEGGEEDIRLRGFSLASTGDIFMDGQRDPAFYDRDTFNLDRLELLRGPASMLFGRGSTGGAVNQVSKGALGYDRHEISGSIGSGSYVRGTVDLNKALGEHGGLRINGMGASARLDGVRTSKTGIALAGAAGLGQRHELQASLYHLDNDNGIHYGLPWVRDANGNAVMFPVDGTPYYGAASDYNRGTASLGTLQHTFRPGGGAGELRTTLRAGRYTRDLRASAIRLCTQSTNATTGVVTNPECPATAPTADTITGSTLLTRGNNHKIQDLGTLYLQSDYDGKFRLGGQLHQVQAGVDIARESFRNFGADALTKAKTTVGTPDDGAGVDEASRRTYLNRTFEARALGVYAQDLWQFAPTWKLLAGLRWDRFSGTYDTPELTSAAGVVTAATHRERSDALWSKRMALLWQPTPLMSWHLSYATSFNTSGDTYQYDALGSNTPPEGSVNYELGGDLDFLDGKLTMRAALFHTVKTNERNRDAESVTPTTYVLSGQRHSAGLEIDLTGQITPTWQVYLSYAWIPDARIDKGVPAAGGTVAQSLSGEAVGSRPGLIPRHSGTVWTTWQATPQWRLGGGLNVRSRVSPYQAPTTEAPGYVTADLMAEYAATDRLRYALNLTNLADITYADQLYRGHYTVGKPRQLMLTGTYRF